MFFLFLPSLRRVGRVVECGSLENYCAAMYRGFESLTLRIKKKNLVNRGFFLHKFFWYFYYYQFKKLIFIHEKEKFFV